MELIILVQIMGHKILSRNVARLDSFIIFADIRIAIVIDF